MRGKARLALALGSHIFISSIQSVNAISAVFPSLIPVGASILTLQASAGETSGFFNLTGVNGLVYVIGASGSSGGMFSLALPSPAVAKVGVLSLATGSSDQTAHVFAVAVYSAPIFSSISPTNVSSAGVILATLSLSSLSAAFPVNSGVQVRVVCGVAGGRSLADIVMATAVGSSSFWYSAQAELLADERGIVFATKSLPALASTCAVVDIVVSFNGGSHWHTGAAGVPVFATPSTIVVPIYSSALLNHVWPQSLNNARIGLATELASAVESGLFYESAYDSTPAGSGTDLASLTIVRAISADRAKLLLMGGGEFKPAVRWAATRYPGVNFLIASSLFNDLSSWGMPNVRAVTGRITEAIFFLGYAAAATSYTGHLGLMLTVDHPTSYGIANAFALGARAAAADGVRRSGAPAVRVSAWMLGTFDDLYAETTAADDLLSRGVDVLLALTDNNDKVSSRVFAQATAARPVFGLGFYADVRVAHGDRVLLSALYNFQALFSDAVARTLAGAPFNAGPNDAGLGVGVELSSVSPLVPLEARAAMARRIAASELSDELDEVFCGTLVDSEGTVRLNATTGATLPLGALASVTGEGGARCLAKRDVQSMGWVLPEVLLPPAGVACAVSASAAYLSDSPTACFLWVPPPLPLLPWFVRPIFVDAIIGILAALILSIALGASGCVIAFRQSLNHSSPVFLLLVNVGAMLYAAALLTFLFDGTSASTHVISAALCQGRLWLQGLGFALLFGSLFAKTQRVHRLFNNRGNRKLRLNALWVLRLLCIVIAAEAVVLMILNLALPCRFATLKDVTGGLQFVMCSASAAGNGPYADPVLLLTIIHVLLLAWGAYLAFRTRSVAAGFNESLWIGLSIYNVLAFECLGFILGSLQTTIPAMQFYTAMVRLGIPPIITLLLLYIPKALAIGKQIRDQHRAEQRGLTPLPLNDGVLDSSSESATYQNRRSGNLSPGGNSSPSLANDRVAPEPVIGSANSAPSGSVGSSLYRSSDAGRGIPGAAVAPVSCGDLNGDTLHVASATYDVPQVKATVPAVARSAPVDGITHKK